VQAGGAYGIVFLLVGNTTSKPTTIKESNMVSVFPKSSVKSFSIGWDNYGNHFSDSPVVAELLECDEDGAAASNFHPDRADLKIMSFQHGTALLDITFISPF
jgi:hypothetical protein